MRIGHFEALSPICPACRDGGTQAALGLASIDREAEGDVEDGVLSCTGCGAEFPILDGLPILVPDLRRFVADNLFYLSSRTELTGTAGRVLGDAAGPGSGLDAMRQHLSTYGWDHWCDLDPASADEPVPGGARAGGVARLVAAALSMAQAGPAAGPALDLGCGAGRSTLEIANRTGRLTLGIDVSFPLARFARACLTSGRADFGLRRIGMVYERRAFPLGADPQALARCDVWICDALALPFRDESFSLAAGLNLLDCARDPAALLSEIARVLGEGAPAHLATPFDWSGNVTPAQSWIGGHSDRGALRGRAEPVLSMLLGGGPNAVRGLAAEGDAREMDWHVRLHDRSAMHYAVHMVAARKRAGTATEPTVNDLN